MIFGGHESFTKKFRYPLLLSCFWVCASFAWANTEYYRHIVFDNSLTPDYYFYSAGRANGTSFLEEHEGRLPVETDRKSTRLNSSHLVISYAVFCLKKKKNLATIRDYTAHC